MNTVSLSVFVLFVQKKKKKEPYSLCRRTTNMGKATIATSKRQAKKESSKKASSLAGWLFIPIKANDDG